MTGKCENFCFQMPDKRNQILVIICQTKATTSDNYAIFDLISTLKVQSIIKAKQGWIYAYHDKKPITVTIL